MDRIAALRAFVQVVDEEGFASAARAMGMSRSGVNRLVVALEDALGTQLLNRTTRVVSPTSTGLSFHARAVRILELLDEAESETRAEGTEATGTLRISGPMTFGAARLGPLVADFMKAHPALRVVLDLNDRVVDIVEEGYDLAVRIGELQEDANLVDFRICEAPRVLSAAPAFLAAHGVPTEPADLRGLACLDYAPRPGSGTWRLFRGEEEVRVRPSVILSSNNGEVLRDAAVAGLGIIVLPTFIVGDDLKARRLVPVLPDWRPPALTLCVVYPPARHLTAKIRLFTEYAIARFAEDPP